MAQMEPLDARDPVFIGPYRLLARLGEGGMGRVYLGMSAGRRVVAVKVIHADHARDPEFRDRFKVEVAAAKKVQGAFTAPVIDSGEDDDPPWLVTSLVTGPSLADVVKAQGPLPSASVWPLVAGLAEALAAVHACGIVHRDVTPGNVLLALDGPRLIDFGLARALGSSNLTATGIVIGTPAFLSPEHVKGDPVGPASDIFSLGSLLVFAATGAGPFGTGDPFAVFGRIMVGEPDFRGLDGPLLEVVTACLAREPGDRPTPAEVIALVPDAVTAGGPATQFWPAALDAFVHSYQASFSVVLPDTPGAHGQSSGLPFKPPREIAAQAAGLAGQGHADQARQLLTTVAALRPDQEVAALISLLRREGRHAEAEVVITAATRRPALEVAALALALTQIGSGPDADTLLDEAAGGSAEQVGALIAALAQADQTTEVRRLMRGAAASAARQPQAIVALVGVLTSAGLGREADRLTDVVAGLVSPAQAAALGDAMRRSSHHEAALRLYSASVGEVALRPPSEVASILRLARDRGNDGLVSRCMDALTVAQHETAAVIELAAALSSASLDEEARRVLAAAAGFVAVTEVIEIAEALLGLSQEKAALSVCAEAAAKDPSSTGVLVDSLRDIGRPVDAFRLLDNLGAGSVELAAEVIAGLRDRSDDADRVLRAFLGQGAELVCDLLVKLEGLGHPEDGSRLAALVDPQRPEPICEVATCLIGRQAYGVADHVLARAARERAFYCCDLIDRLMRPAVPSLATGLARQGSDFPMPERRAASGRVRPGGGGIRAPGADLFAWHWRAHHDQGGLLSCLRSLRTEGLGVAAHGLLSYAARISSAELVEFARELDWTDDGPASGRAARPTGPDRQARQARPFWPGTKEAAALIAAAATAGRASSDFEALLEALLDRDGLNRLSAAIELFSVIRVYPGELLVTVAMGLNAAVPGLLSTYVRVTAPVLPDVLVTDNYRGDSRLLRTYGPLLEAAGAHLPFINFCDFYLNLRQRALLDEASFLLAQAAANPEAPAIVADLRGRGLRREAKQLALAVRQRQ
ncbi:MAG TPA: serine/threonine-protein kinase [Streptosporangiaceae bacterium]|nr:serine/threonine-protein kinase [Streptosporangiaceae bacterium]